MRARNESENTSPRASYGEFIRRAAVSSPVHPNTREEWDDRLRGVADDLRSAFGLTSVPDCDLDAEVLGVIERDDYVIERLTFQTRPGVRTTANLYRPRRQEGPTAAVLGVHGHWKWARIDPGVQTRCIGLARLGYVCLCVDAFGAGERAVEPGPGTYHGGPMGASLWAVGTPLIGLQVHDNRRAIDYLISRPEVDASRLGITGASGGGNQSLYAGALDDRIKAVVPVCGVGTYESYLAAACCVCEVNPSGLTYARTSDLLAMAAPRALLVVSATQDAHQFSVGEAAKSLAIAKVRFEALGVPDRVRQVIIDSGHDYNQPMREAMYGWMDLWLRDRGDGSPVSEPEIHPEDPALIRCYPDAESRPKSIVTIPQFFHREASERLAELPPAPDHREAWEAEAAGLKAALCDEVLGGLPATPPPRSRIAFDAERRLWTLENHSEPGIELTGYLVPPPMDLSVPFKGTVVLADEDDVDADSALSRSQSWTQAGYAVFVIELRALGRRKPDSPSIAGAVDHNEAEWGVWIGRPLLGQWVFDMLQWLHIVDEILAYPPSGFPTALSKGERILQGRGVAGTAALLASAYAPDVETTVVDSAVVRLLDPQPTVWTSARMGILAPNILKSGDFGRFASLVAPRRLIVVEGLDANAERLSQEALDAAFEHPRSVYALYSASDALMTTATREEASDWTKL